MALPISIIRFLMLLLFFIKYTQCFHNTAEYKKICCYNCVRIITTYLKFIFIFQMHSASFDTEINGRDGGEVLVALAALVTEGRIPGKLNSKTKGFYEGPHCPLNKTNRGHKCDLSNLLVRKILSSFLFLCFTI